MKTKQDLRNLLNTINRKSYPAYKDTRGSYQFGDYILSIDHVQGDPFASPSKVSVTVPGKTAGLPAKLYDLPHKKTALEDHLLRLFGRAIERFQFKAKGSGKSGLMSVSRPGQEVLKRSACTIHPESGDVLVRMEIGFPAHGRTIDSMELMKILFDFLPGCVEESLFYSRINKKKAQEAIHLSEDQEYIRSQLHELGLVAFVANEAILPRESGVSSRPMKNATPFQSPKSMEVTMTLPHGGSITGMGIRKGITLIVGGGYHGKSTLLKALELGVYNHIAGDGREYVITDSSAVKIRAEDGRSIKKTDISMFINNLPNGKDTTAFSTEDASGSTSQAANVIEAMEASTSLFLIDEDTCATNFMIRDELMQRVVHRNQEPITPFIERVQALYEKLGISCVMVAGSSGAYFHVSDCVVQMDRYIPKEITELARTEASKYPGLEVDAKLPQLPEFHRIPMAGREFRRGERVKMKTLGKDAFSINRDTVDLRYLEQLVDSEQTAALSFLVKYAQSHLCDGRRSLRQIVDELMKLIETKGLEILADGSYLSSNLALPRRQEIFACFDRYRGQSWK